MLKLSSAILITLAMAGVACDSSEPERGSVGDEIADTRAAFMELTREKLDILEDEMESLEARIEEVSDDSRAELDNALREWRREHQKLEEQLENAEQRAADGWDRFQSDIDAGMDGLRHAYEDLKNRLETS